MFENITANIDYLILTLVFIVILLWTDIGITKFNIKIIAKIVERDKITTADVLESDEDTSDEDTELSNA